MRLECLWVRRKSCDLPRCTPLSSVTHAFIPEQQEPAFVLVLLYSRAETLVALEPPVDR
jgi:hypothetical protein